MRRGWSTGLLLAVVATVVALTGCFSGGGGNPAGESALSSALPLSQGAMGGATVRFAIQVDSDVNSPRRAAIRLATDTVASDTATPSVRFMLTTIYTGRTSSNTATIEQTVPIIEGTAEAVFTDVPARPTLADVWIYGPEGTGLPAVISGTQVLVTRFHGALDLSPGENIIAVQPFGSRFRRDIIAQVAKWLLTQPELFILTRGNLIHQIESAVAYMDRGPETAVQEAQDKVREMLTRRYDVQLSFATPTTDVVIPAYATLPAELTVVDASATVDSVELYLNNTLVHRWEEAPYRTEISSMAPGVYRLDAYAYSKPGDVVATAGLGVTVLPPVVPEPQATIRIVNPVDGATFTAGANLVIEVVATGTEEQLERISTIEFFEGTTKIGESSLPPYTITWNDVAIGSYTLSARARGKMIDYLATAPDVLISVGTQPNWDGAALYTTSADFQQGTLIGLECSSVPDQLQLSSRSTTLPFIWIPNSGEGTISKVDTRDGRELGRYRVARQNNSSPSRTTVDLYGNCWVGCRGTSTMVKVGLEENGPVASGSAFGGWIDRNGNGVCDTSRDTNGNGLIEGDEMLSWGQDECVLWEVVLIPGQEATYAAGAYQGPYANNDWNPGPRGVAIDANNHCWAGTYGTQRYYLLNGATGQIMKDINVSSANHGAYGAVVDRNGIVWSAGQSWNNVLWLDPRTDQFGAVAMGHFVYGIGLDRNGHLFATGWSDSKISRLNVNTKTKEWTKEGIWCQRGVCVTDDGDVWTADTGPSTVTRYDNDGNKKATIQVGGDPTGVSIDADGKVWVVCLDASVKKIDPANNQIILNKTIGGDHYCYSDMTGIVVRTNTTRLGKWNVVRDTGRADTVWNGVVRWDADQPAGTTVQVKVRSSTDNVTWSSWEVAANGSALTATPGGRYLEIELTVQVSEGEGVPVVRQVSVGL